MTSIQAASAEVFNEVSQSDQRKTRFGRRHSQADCAFGRRLCSEDPFAFETIQTHLSVFMNDPQHLCSRQRFPDTRHSTVDMVSQNFPHRPIEVAAPPCSYLAPTYPNVIYTNSPPTPYVAKPNESGIPSEMANEVGYMEPQGRCLPHSWLQQAQMFPCEESNGYTCGPIICPSAASRPQPGLPPWLYPPTQSFPFLHNVPCYTPASVYPMVYSQGPYVYYGHTRPSSGIFPEQTADPCNVESSIRPLTSRLIGNEQRSTPTYFDDSARTRVQRNLARSSSDNSSQTQSNTVDPVNDASQPKISCVSDRKLSQFKMNKADAFKIQDIKGHMLAFCLDQSGSRFIQEQLDVTTVEETDSVHEELAAHSLMLMRDVFGNYIIQILFQKGSSKVRQHLAEILREHTLSLTLHVYGCRVIQKALEVLDMHRRIEIVRNLDAHVTRCIKDMNGNHVIQKAIRELDLDSIPFISKAVLDRVHSFAVHPYGCRVVQRVLERESTSKNQESIKSKILTVVVENIGELSQDLYGNYVAQHAIRYCNRALRTQAIEALLNAPVDYACHKYASNVLEQALFCGDREQRRRIVESILQSPQRGDNADPLSLLTTNRFGNYVVQRMLDVVDDDLKCMIVRLIAQRMRSLKKFKYGKHIVTRVEKMLSNPSLETGHAAEHFSAASIA